MVPIKQFKTYFESFKTDIPLINTVIMVYKEDDLAAKIKSLGPEQFPLLVCIVPSADGNSLNVDSYKDKNTSLVYMLTKIDKVSSTDETKLDAMDMTQQIMEDVKKKMISDASIPGHLLFRLELNSMHTDPEYDYLGCDGWSLGFMF